MLPSLDTGLSADDYLHELILRGSHVLDGFDRPRLDIFRFCDPRYFEGWLRQGIFTWWDDPNTRLAFFRPVSALTHYVDHTLWPDSAWLMHLHSLLWGALVLFGVRALFRQLVSDRLVCALALALYALDDARAWFVSWVASRNGVVATAFSVWALYFFVRGRRGARTASWVALPLLALGLLAGEGAIAIYGYLFAHALFLEQGTLRARLLRLWPYAALLLVWRVVYRALGYGVSGSSLYVDPLGEPVRFALRFLERAPVLLFAQVGGPWSDTWNSLFVFPRLRVAVYLGALAALALVFALCVRAVRQSPLVRFGLLGALLSTVPASTAFPADRLLTWAALGASVVLASALAPVLRGELRAGELSSTPWVARLAPLAVFCLVVSNLLLAPLFAVSRARGNVGLRDILARSELGVPKDASVEDKVIVYVNPPAVPLASYTPITRAALGIPRARMQRILATSTTPLRIERIDGRTLRISPRGGFLQSPASKLMWSEDRPFSPGERIVLEETSFFVRRVTGDHRPLEVDVRFDRPLSDPRYLFLHWVGAHYVPFTPPSEGRNVTLQGADYMQVMFGVPLPIEARLDP